MNYAHNVLMTGPPGAGKTLLARSMPSILPTMTVEEALEATKIYSIAGLLPPDTPLIRHRPFRAPHHTISHAGLVGGGHWPRPGEISLAHRGVLFLDELPEFGTRTLEGLRQPIEDRKVVISRATGTLISGADYYGYHDDEWDCFSIDVCTTGQITADLTGTGEGVCLLLYYQSSENLVGWDCTPPYHIEYSGSAGRYYICIYTESGHNTDTPYTLRATFP